jgi:hypothetical protein
LRASSPSIIRTAVTNLIMNHRMAQAPGEQGQEFASGLHASQSARCLIADYYDYTGKLDLCAEKNGSVPRLWGDVWDSVARSGTDACLLSSLPRSLPRRSAPKGGAHERRDEKLSLAPRPGVLPGTACPGQNCPVAETQLLPRSASRRSFQLKVWIKC